MIGKIFKKLIRKENNLKKEPSQGPLFIDTPRRICLLFDIIPFICFTVNI